MTPINQSPPYLLPLRVPKGLLEGTADEAPEDDPHRDTGVPIMHVAPLCGWGSDPHGPIYYKGRYHLFYQARPGTCQWFWGLRWEHVVSNDLVTWLRLPPALLPTPGGLDADGCFTGNIQVHTTSGVPMLFYTGARLRHNPTVTHPDPPPDACNPLMFHWETQLCAVADPDDELLVHWRKVETPWMELPHCAYLSSWRDPFFVPPELDPKTGLPLHELQGGPQQARDGDEEGAQNLLALSKLGGKPGASHLTSPPSSQALCGDQSDSDTGSPSLSPTISSCISSVQHSTAPSADGTPKAPLSPPNGLSNTEGSPSSTTPGPDSSKSHPSGPPSALTSSTPTVSNLGTTFQLPKTHASSTSDNSANTTTSFKLPKLHNTSDNSDAQSLTFALPKPPTTSAEADDLAFSAASTQPTVNGKGREHMMLIGSGLEGLGGTALIYRSDDLATGWRFEGYLCTWPNLDTGICWECPHLLNLPDLPQGLSCMTAVTEAVKAGASTVGAVNSPAAGSAAFGANEARPAPSTKAPATPTPRIQTDFQQQQDLQKLVNQAWVSSGLTMSSAIPWQDKGAVRGASPTPAPTSDDLETSDVPETTTEISVAGPSLSPLMLNVLEDSLHQAALTAATIDVANTVVSLSTAASDAAIALATNDSLDHGNRDSTANVNMNSSVMSSPAHITTSHATAAATATTHMAAPRPFATAQAQAEAMKALDDDEDPAPGESKGHPGGGSNLTAFGSMTSTGGIGDAASRAVSRTTSLHMALALSRQASNAEEQDVQRMLMDAMTDIAAARKNVAGMMAQAESEAQAAAAQQMERAQSSLPQLTAADSKEEQRILTEEADDIPSDLPSDLPSMLPQARPPDLQHSASAPPAQMLVDSILAGRHRAASAAINELNNTCNDASEGGEAAAAVPAVAAVPSTTAEPASNNAPTVVSPAAAATDRPAPANAPLPPLPPRRSTSAHPPLPPRPSQPSITAAPAGPESTPAPLATRTSTPLSPMGSGLPSALLSPMNSLLTPSGVGKAASLADIKATGEASVAGLGYVSVLSSSAPRDAVSISATTLEAATAAAAAAQHGNSMTAPQPSGPSKTTMPTPPALANKGLSKQEIRAACRAYAEAAAAVQGHDLGCPSNDAEVVQRCREDGSEAGLRARPDQRWFLGLAPDAATYGILYFLGSFKDNRFQLDDAHGPYKLDLGNVLYAPVAYYDRKHGRHIVWGYLKELRKLPPPPCMCNKFVASGCVSLPRALYLKEGRLHQVPIPEMSRLRTGECWRQQQVPVPASLTGGVKVPAEFAGDHLDMEITVRRGKSEAIAILLHSWRKDNEGEAALRYYWDTRQLEVVYGGLHGTQHQAALQRSDTNSHHGHETLGCVVGLHTVEPEGGVPYTVFVDPKVPPVPELNPDVPDWIRMKPSEAGGELWMEEDEPLRLRIFIDASAVEVFTGTGQVLCTRVYRGYRGQTKTDESGLQIVSMGGAAELDLLEVHKTRSAWVREEDVPLPHPVTRHDLERWRQHDLL